MTTPTNIAATDIRFGIEIETLGRGPERVARTIQTVVGGYVQSNYSGGYSVVMDDGRKWNAVYDGSLSGTHAEIVSPICTDADMDTVQKIVRAVRRDGSRVNTTCGIHVHVDAGGTGSRGEGPDKGAFSHAGKDPAKTIRNLAKMCFKYDDLIAAALNISDHRRENYCWAGDEDFVTAISRDRNLTLDRMNTRWYGYHQSSPSHYNNTRYHGLNLHNVWYRGTVEFRWFEASLHAGVVKAYIQFCRCLAAKAINARSASMAKTPLRSESAKYDFRCFLLSLGMIGDEYKSARLHLLKNLTGCSAYKHGRPEGA